MVVNELLSPIYTSSLLKLLATNLPDHRFVESQTKDVGFAGTHSIIALGHSLGVVRALSIFCVAVRTFKTLHSRNSEQQKHACPVRVLDL